MIVGYARTSTLDQVHGLNSQIDDLNQVGCEKIYSEQISSVAARKKLDEAMEPEFQREVQRFQANFNLTSLPRF